MASANAGELVGQTLGDYKLLALLGAGGMAEVYRARDGRRGRIVAVKVLPPSLASDPEYVQRFRDETRRVRALDHINVVPVLAYGEERGLLYLVMPLLQESLRERMEREKLLPLVDAAKIVVQVAAALDAAHGQGIVHRDVKPENILLDVDGRAHLTDFGIARDADFLKKTGSSRTLASTGLPVGTPEYMAPEQLRGESVDHRVDIYSLGVVLYELLTGTPPYTAGSPYEVASLVLAGTHEPPSSHNPLIWPELDDVVLQALAANPRDRFPDTRTFAVALRNAVLRRESRQAGTLTMRGRDAPTVPLDADAERVGIRGWMPSVPAWLSPARYLSPRRGRGVLVIASVVALVVLLACAGSALALVNGFSLPGGTNPFYRSPANGGIVSNTPTTAQTYVVPTASDDTPTPTTTSPPTATPTLAKPKLSIAPLVWKVQRNRDTRTCSTPVSPLTITNQSGFTVHWQWLSGPGNLTYSFGSPSFNHSGLPSRTNVASGQSDKLYVSYFCPNRNSLTVQVRVSDAAHPQNTTTYTITLQPGQAG